MGKLTPLGLPTSVHFRADTLKSKQCNAGVPSGAINP